MDDFCHAGLTIASLWRTSAARLVDISHASKLLVTICLGELAGLEGLHEDSWRGKSDLEKKGNDMFKNLKGDICGCP